MDDDLQIISENQVDNIVVRSFLHTNDRKQIDERIITDVKNILANIIKNR